MMPLIPWMLSPIIHGSKQCRTVPKGYAILYMISMIVTEPCIIFKNTKKYKYWYIAYHGLLTKPLEYNLQSTAQ